jgi:mono/diheme cytochrome c family protein
MMRYILMALVLAGCVEQGGVGPDVGPDPARDFAENCAACHGADGRGDGAAGAGLLPKPADLTGLAARNGGVFPTTRVMAYIWRGEGAAAHRAMPAFAGLMEGALVPYDGGDGIETPTPERLVALAEYLKTIQD